MTHERWRDVSRLFSEALTRESEARATFLADACRGDDDLRRDVESLLAQHASNASLAGPVMVGAAPVPVPVDLIDRQVGSYRITGRLGVGGMGVVYRAHDARLGRDVAIKVLPPSFPSGRDDRSRFEREARLLAALNHPNIGAIYGVEESDHGRALVLELIEGDTLADRLAKFGALEIAEALRIARQIAEALDAAHDKGIIHRDLKPSNVKITAGGVAKVLDFGIGKVVTPDATDRSGPPTAPNGDTREGVIVGTPAYMSPEQARGQAVDKRSDVWAFGCVLFEMLTGRRAFEGDGIADTLSRVLQREPDLARLPEDTPPAVRRLLVRCFDKDRHKRLPSIAIATFQIDEALVADAAEADAPRAGADGLTRLLVASLAGAVLVMAALVWTIVQPPADVAAPVAHLQMSVAPADELGGADGRPNRPAFALSPDGRTLVFSAVQQNRRALYVRPLDQATATAIPGTESGVHPFFSPDGQWVGYWAANQLRKVALAGGPPVVVQAVPQIFGASWDEDDRIVFAQSSGGLLEVSASGGTAAALTSPDRERGHVSHRLPHALPGGDAVLFTVTRKEFPRWDESEIWLHSRTTRSSKLLIEGGADARYVSSGHLVYAKEGVLLAVPFDLERLEVTGGPVGVISDVMQAAYMGGGLGETGAAQIAVSASGTLVYLSGGVSPPRESTVVQVDRTGRAEPLPILAQDYRTARISPDGARLALSTLGRDRSMWLYSFARGTLSKLATAGNSAVGVWTPDAQRLVYAGGSAGPDNLHWTLADGGGSPEVLVSSSSTLVPAAMTPDGRHVFYYSIPNADSEQAGPVIWTQDLSSMSAPRALSSADVPNVGGVDVSPDGKWIAYHSRESGQLQVYVEAFPGPGPRHQVSTDSGGSPVWRADGRELFYARANEGPAGMGYRGTVGLMAVAVTAQPTLGFGTPRQLFAGHYIMNAPARGYDVTPDGQRFVFFQARERAAVVIRELSVVQNWVEELKRRIPSR